MKIQYLGTAAAEGIPALFCTCDVCREARKRGGKNIRTRSQAIIDDELLIDFPADTYMHCLNYNIDLSKIKNCLVTHTHSDHLYLEDISMRMPGFSNLDNDNPITFYGSWGTALYINSHINKTSFNPKGIVEVKFINLYEKMYVGNYIVTALEAVHTPSSNPVMYIIEDKQGKRLLYGHDTHYFCDSVWDYLEKNKIKLDFVSLDCTHANNEEMQYIGHMVLNDNIKIANRLKKLGCADDNTVFCSNHFSHNAKDVLYEEFSEIANKSGFIASYDGMIINF